MKKKTAAQSKFSKIMREFKAGTLHSGINPKGPKKAPLAKSRKQAIAIAISVTKGKTTKAGRVKKK